MKKIFAFTGVLAAVVMMGSCGNKTEKFPFDNGDSLDVANVDPTIYGVCSDGSSMNVPALKQLKQSFLGNLPYSCFTAPE